MCWPFTALAMLARSLSSKLSSSWGEPKKQGSIYEKKNPQNPLYQWTKDIQYNRHVYDLLYYSSYILPLKPSVTAPLWRCWECG